MIKLKRAYENPEKKDGYRVLVDRLWPRGMKKTDLPLNDWMKELAPSTELRKSFAHDPDNWADFRKRYKAELRSSKLKDKIEALAKRGAKASVTLIYSAKDTEHNQAVVLKDVLDREIKARK